MQPIAAQLVESRVDYITATCLLDKLMDGSELVMADALADDLLTEQERRGNDVRRFHLMGFDGLASGQVSVGKSELGFLFRISGETAGARWQDVYDLSTNVSRLDVAATYELKGAWLDLSRVHHAEALDYQKRTAPRMKVTRIDGGKDGCSLLIGSRVSDEYGRCYDKELESKDEAYQNCWRYEVEFKRDAANLAASELAARSSDPLAPAVMASRWFARRRISPPQLSEGCCFTRSSQQPSDDLRRLRWFRAGCRGPAQKLIASGKGKELLIALGLNSDVLSGLGYIRRPTTEGEQD